MTKMQSRKLVALIFESPRAEWSEDYVSKITSAPAIQFSKIDEIKQLIYKNFKSRFSRAGLANTYLVSWDKKNSYYGIMPSRMFGADLKEEYLLFELNVDEQSGLITLFTSNGEIYQRKMLE